VIHLVVFGNMQEPLETLRRRKMRGKVMDEKRR
jgi:hypothetical protein